MMSCRLVPNPQRDPSPPPRRTSPLTTQAPVTRHLHVGFDSVLANNNMTRGKQPVPAKKSCCLWIVGNWLARVKGSSQCGSRPNLSWPVQIQSHTLFYDTLFCFCAACLPAAVSADSRSLFHVNSENGGGPVLSVEVWFRGIIGQNPRVLKSDHLHIDICRFVFGNWRYIA